MPYRAARSLGERIRRRIPDLRVVWLVGIVASSLVDQSEVAELLVSLLSDVSRLLMDCVVACLGLTVMKSLSNISKLIKAMVAVTTP